MMHEGYSSMRDRWSWCDPLEEADEAALLVILGVPKVVDDNVSCHYLDL